MRKTLLVGGFTLAVLGGIAWFYHLSTHTAPAGPAYVTGRVAEGTVVQTVTATGTVTAANQVTVYTPVSGIAGDNLPQVGDRVHAGEVIPLQPEPSLADQLTMDEDALQGARLNLAEVEATTPDVKDTGAAALLTVDTPWTGTVQTTEVAAGQTVKAGTVLATVTDEKLITVQAELPFYEAGGLSPGQTVRIAMLGSDLTGRIQTVGSTNPTANGEVTVTVETHRMGALEPGMSGGLTFYPNPSGNPSWAISGNGIVGPGPTRELVSPYDGVLVSFTLQPGDRLQAGEPVARVESSDPGTIQNARLQVQEAEAKVAADRAELSGLRLVIPVSGVVTQVSANAGQILSAGAAVLSVVDPQNLEVTVPVDQVDVGALRVGEAVSVTSPGVPGRVFPATITAVSPVGTNSNGVSTFPVTVALRKSSGLEPGMTAVVTFTIASGRGLTVPLSAIRRQNGQTFVLLLTPRGPRPRSVRVGLESDTLAIVEGRLRAGEEVVLASQADAQRLMNAQKGGFGFFRALHRPVARPAARGAGK